MPTSPDLNALRRRAELEACAESTVDLLVVGGGITGVGVALDAAARGLSVALIEAQDLAFGTSRWSSKLVHGGLRYLATGDFATARESALERHLLMSVIAPHLIRPVPQLIPFLPGVSLRQRMASVVGTGVGDILRIRAGTPRTILPTPRLISARLARELTPAISGDRLRGAMLSFDGQLIDDARLVVAVARTAANLGARILTRVRAMTLRSNGASAEDTLTGERIEIRARAVVNATGVWAGHLDESIRMRPSRGTHIVLDAALLEHPTAALTMPHEHSISRYVFALPQQLGRILIGVTDQDAPGHVPDVASPTESEIDFLLATINRGLGTPIRRGDVLGAFAALRPLIDSDTEVTADIARRHLVSVSESGHVNVLGGKLTTYRRMAQGAVDLATTVRGIPAPPSRTDTLALIGAQPPMPNPSTLVGRYGSEASRVRSMGGGSTAVVAAGIDVTCAEVEFAVRAEGALTASDVLDRRSRIGLVDRDRATALPTVEAIVDRTLASLD